MGTWGSERGTFFASLGALLGIYVVCGRTWTFRKTNTLYHFFHCSVSFWRQYIYI